MIVFIVKNKLLLLAIHNKAYTEQSRCHIVLLTIRLIL